MGSRSKLTNTHTASDWQTLDLLLHAYDFAVAEHPSTLARELFDEALVIVRHHCEPDTPRGQPVL